MKNISKKTIVALYAITSILLFTNTAHAVLKIRSPYVKKGEISVELYGTYNRDDSDSKDGRLENVFEFGYGVTDYWKPEIEIFFSDRPDQSSKITAYEIVNKFQLFDKGKYFIDAGIYTAWEKHTDNKKADKFEAHLLLSKDLEKWRHRANIIFEQEIGENANENLEIGLSWQTAYKYSDDTKFAVEYFADFGELDKRKDYNNQSHQLGALVIHEFEKQNIEVKFGYLAGISETAPDHTLRWEVEYKF